MINAILKGLFALINSMVSILLYPIDTLIKNYIPDLSNAFNYIGAFFEYAGRFLGFCVSVTGLSSTALSLIALFFTFKLTVPILVSAIKVGIKWYRALMP